MATLTATLAEHGIFEVAGFAALRYHKFCTFTSLDVGWPALVFTAQVHDTIQAPGAPVHEYGEHALKSLM
ncbi:hypothetical protein VTO73DRAFT_6151 [Trametes versicolor]